MSYYPQFSEPFRRFLSEAAGKQFVVVGHQRPDGDCVGSQVALCRMLRTRGIDAVCMSQNPVPRRIKFLVGDTPFLYRDALVHDGRVAIFTDCADHNRAGDKVRQLYDEVFASFDHHISNSGFAQHNFVDKESAATAEILGGLFFDHDLQIDVTIAQALYTGIMTDTNQFRISSTSERVFFLCAKLVSLGASPAWAGVEIYERESSGKLKLLQHYLGSLRFECSGRLCLGVLPNGIFEQVGAMVEDTEGLVDYARAIEGVDIGVLIEERTGVIKASLRAKSPAFRMDTVAAKFDGGGHASAAGLNCSDSLSSFYSKLVAALAQRLAEVDTIAKK